MKQSVCKSCARNIAWAKTERDRRTIPINPTPAYNGNLVIVGNDGTGAPIVRYIKRDTLYHGERYTAHFATCANAERHRKAKPNARAGDERARYEEAMRAGGGA